MAAAACSAAYALQVTAVACFKKNANIYIQQEHTEAHKGDLKPSVVCHLVVEMLQFEILCVLAQTEPISYFVRAHVSWCLASGQASPPEAKPSADLYLCKK